MLNAFPNGINAGVVTLQGVVHYDAAFAIQAGLFGQRDIGFDANRHDEQIAGQLAAVLKAHATNMAGFIAEMFRRFDYTTIELDLGGGMGVPYVAGDDPLDVADMAARLRAIVVNECAAAGVDVPSLSVEPGRAIVGPSTVTLYEVGVVKPVQVTDEFVRQYVAVDGGMSDNIRTALYDAQYTVELANRRSEATLTASRVVGKHCESGDIVVRDAALPTDVVAGDLLAVATTGAYGRSMASNYNNLPRPAVVAVRDGQARVIIRRETYDDLLRLDADA